METTTEAINVVTSIWNQLINAPSHLLLLLVLMLFGMLIKKSPTPNWTIPWILVSVGAGTYPLLSSPTNIHPSFPNPVLVLHIYGGLLGVGAIGLHIWLRRYTWFKTFENGIVNAFRDEDKQMIPTGTATPDIDPQKPTPP